MRGLFMQTPDMQIRVEDDRTGLSPETLRRAFLDNLFYLQGKFPRLASKNDYYMALAYTVRDRLFQRWLGTTATYLDQQQRTVCYLSAEFLMGPHLGNNLINLGIYDQVKRQEKVAQAYLDPERWTRMSILNTVRMGKFSSDRAIREYCEAIWQVHPVPIDLDAYPFDAGSCEI